MKIIKKQIENCRQCDYVKETDAYTTIPYVIVHDYYCGLSEEDIIDYIEPDEDFEIPEWCELEDF